MKQTLFESKSLTKTYRSGSFALSKMNLQINAGEITGVVGENGNGKTTLLRIIAGELANSGGSINYPEIKYNIPQWDSIKQSIAYIPQRIPRWFGSLKDNLQFKAALNGITGDENEKKVNELLSLLGLEKFASHKWTEISTGYRLRFELARVMLGEPQLLVLDEPIANLDIVAQQKFLNDLKYFVENKGMAVVLSTQQLHQIEGVSDSIIFLKQGEVVYSGDVKEVGQERTENTFELSVDAGLKEVQSLFSEDELIKIKSIANNLLLDTSLELDANQILSKIIDANIQVNYFRNISQSTKKLFDQ